METSSLSLNDLLKIYNKSLKNDITPKNKKRTNVEFEIRFFQKNITFTIFERVFSELISRGFKIKNKSHSMKILIDYDTPDKDDLTSKTRIELDDLFDIQNLCNNNLLSENVKYVTKDSVDGLKKDNFNNNYGFKTSIKKETLHTEKNIVIKKIEENWATSLKIFRLLHRTSLVHDDYPNISIDMSKVKENSNKNTKFIESNVLNTKEKYEIEIEIIHVNKPFDDGIRNTLLKYLQNTIKFVLSSIQNTMYPIPFGNIRDTLNQYNKIFNFNNNHPKNFIGPSSNTLQKINLKTNPLLNNVVFIDNNFCVTDKADGNRKILFVNNNLQLCFINTSMNVQYTGLNTNDDSFIGTIIDGEHITKDKFNNNVNIYTTFDIYRHGKKDVRKYPFKDKDEATPNKKQRYLILGNVLDKLIDSIDNKKENSLKIINKNFYFTNDAHSIFNASKECLHMIKKSNYNTDGLIYSSMNLGVGFETPDDKLKNSTYTWNHSFKWKPPEYNTIDFLISFTKDNFNNPIIKTKKTNDSVIQYYEIKLYVGVDEKKHGIFDSQKKLLEKDFGRRKKKFDYKSYKPELFYPTNPIDKDAHICHVELKSHDGKLKIFTEENEIIEDDTIVEFKYDLESVDKYNSWKPLKVRYDKTNQYRNNNNNFGNAYHVANNNWQTIHNPVTEQLLINGENIELEKLTTSSDDIYYNSANTNRKDSKTNNLRLFHNDIKNILIQYASKNKSKCSLIDLAVGKGGDIHKWIKNNLHSVLGIDISKDNIHNSNDGACARYLDLLNNRYNYKQIPICMFIHGDTSKRIFNDEFDFDDDYSEDSLKSSYIFKSLTGSINKSEIKEEFLNENYGIFKNKFDICSIQFAVHYMFKDEKTLHTFIKNVSDTTKIGSYFIGTCYNGKVVYEKLKEKDTIELFKDNNKIFHIKKKYNDNSDVFLNNNNNSLGYTISVYQESINKEFDEYLVNFDYFKSVMKDYGFILEENFNYNNTLTKSVDSFENLYNNIANLSLKDKKKYNWLDKLTKEEKEISFLNNYFIFKKISDNIIDVYNDDVDYNKEFIIEKAIKLDKKIILKKE